MAEEADRGHILYLADGGEGQVELFVLDEKGNPEQEGRFQIWGLGPAEQVRERLEESWQRLAAWETQLVRQILEHALPQDILTQGQAYLCHEYTLIDSDMNVIFATPGYQTELASAKSGGKEEVRLSDDLIQALLMRKDFHEAAQETGGFYFYDHYTEAALYCRNLFLHGQYYARLICRLREGETRIPQGEEQLVGLFAGYLELLFQNDLPNPGRHPNDTLHQLCQSLCAGEQPDVARLQMALYPYQWKLSHRFRAVVLHAYREEGWQTHMETTLPFLIRELEHQWRDSCAILLGERTSCISTEPPSAAGWNRSKNSQAFLRFPGNWRWICSCP